MRAFALKVIKKGLQSVKTSKIIKENLYQLKDFDKFFVVGVGKCAFEAAFTLEKLLIQKIQGGMIIDINIPFKLKKIKTYQGTHPFSSLKNVKATKKIIDFLKKLKEDDKVLMIISGGGSALLSQPKNNQWQKENELIKNLMAKGATIRDLNIVRKHLSFARGGFLAKYAYPAKIISFIFSDVPGDRLEIISSGPTFKDQTNIQDAKKILKKYLPSSRLFSSYQKLLLETPKEDKYFQKVKNILVASNKKALKEMAHFAQKFGFKVKIKDFNLQGEAKKVGEKIVKEIRKEKPKTILLYGGETTVKVTGSGKGGRNQELVLSALRLIKDNELIIAFASDGLDNSEVAGAIADKITKNKVKNLKLNIEDYLKENNSYEFFQKTGDFIKTGPTGINIADLILALKI